MLGRAEVRVGSRRRICRMGARTSVSCSTAVRCTSRAQSGSRTGWVGRSNCRRSFTLDEDPDEMGQFLAQAGFFISKGYSASRNGRRRRPNSMTAIDAAESDDGASWWAQTDAGERYPARILGFNQKSRALRTCCTAIGFPSIGTFTDDQYVQRDPDVGDSAEGLLKKVHVVEGISDVSWHKDCAMGGHSRHCCGLTVGISDHRGRTARMASSVWSQVRIERTLLLLGIEGLDLARLPLPTRTGDVTVHCSCTLHMSRPPVSAERRVVYTGFGLAPRPGDHQSVVQRTPEEIRRGRANLADRREGVRPGSRARLSRQLNGKSSICRGTRWSA